MSVAFHGMDSLVVTFQGSGVAEGNLVSITENDTVKRANGGAAPVGLVLNKRNDHVAVQIKGYIQVKYSGATAPSLGWNRLVTDGSGSLRLEADGETGRTCLVVNLDPETKTMGLFL